MKAPADAAGYLKIRRPGTQSELAKHIGIRQATLTHHLNAMEAHGLVARTREAANRRVQVVTLTEKGTAAFVSMAAAATAFDAKLRACLAETDLATLETLLGRLTANVTIAGEDDPPWASLTDSH